jgi:hypothetical protein
MGTWGPGNFENDCAADHLYRVCGPLLKEVQEAMQDPSSLEPDELYGVLVPGNLEIIACLSESLGRHARGGLQDFLYPCVLPPPETVAEWKEKFLAIWDACIDGLSPKPEYKRQRREVLVATFDRVERLARGRYEGKSHPDIRSYIADVVSQKDDPETPEQAPNVPAGTPLLELNLSVRATNCLESQGIATVEELRDCTADELLEIRNFAETTLSEVREKLAEKGLRLRE